MAITAALVKELRERTGSGMMECKKALTETNGDLEAAADFLRQAGKAKADKRSSKVAAEGRIVAAISDDQQSGIMLELNCETDFVAKDANFVDYANRLAAAALTAGGDEVSSLLALSDGDKTFEETRQELTAKLGENVQLRRATLQTGTGMVGSYLHGDRIGVLVAMDKVDEGLARDVAMHIAAANPLSLTIDDLPADLVEREKKIFTAQAAESGKPADIIEKMIAGRINKFAKENSLLEQPFIKNPDQTVAQLLKEAGANVQAFVRFEVGEGIEKETVDFAEEVMAQVKGN